MKTKHHEKALKEINTLFPGVRSVIVPGSLDVDFICSSELEAYKLAYHLAFLRIKSGVTLISDGNVRVTCGDFLNPDYYFPGEPVKPAG